MGRRKVGGRKGRREAGKKGVRDREEWREEVEQVDWLTFVKQSSFYLRQQETVIKNSSSL